VGTSAKLLGGVQIRCKSDFRAEDLTEVTVDLLPILGLEPEYREQIDRNLGEILGTKV